MSQNQLIDILNPEKNGVDFLALCEQVKNYQGGEIILEKDDTTGVATIQINSPGKKNAFSGSMMVQFSDIVDQLEKWNQGRAVIIYGANGFFCSGGDMTTVKVIDNSEGGLAMGLIMQRSLARLQSLPLISVALIEGQAIGGGAELSTVCDFRVMTSNARIGFVHIIMGISVGWGGGNRLVQIVGANKALELMTNGKQVNAEQCMKIGLANAIIECDKNESTLEKTKQWLNSQCVGSTEALRVIKQIVAAAQTLPRLDALSKELQLFTSVWGSVTHKAALAKNIKHR